MSRLGFGLGLDVIQAVAAGGGGPSGADLKTDLAAWWAMDETSGDRADSHTNSYDLTDVNTVGSVTGKVGAKAAFFVAAPPQSEKFSRANSASEDWQMGLADLTVGFWIKFTSWDTFAQQTCFATGANIGTAEGYLMELPYPGTTYNVIISNGSTSLTLSGTWDGGAPTLGVWYFILIEYDRSDKISVWKNNVKESDDVDISSFVSDDIISTQIFAIASKANAATEFIDGAMDEFFIHNRLITADEKTWLWNDGDGRAYSEIG